MSIIIYIALGLVAGVFGGLLGLGGGIVLVPALLYIFGLSQHEAQGTSLFIMLPPVTALAAWRYYMAGNVRVSMAVFVCIGFLFGGYAGAFFSHLVPDTVLKRVFGVLLFFVSVKMIIGK